MSQSIFKVASSALAHMQAWKGLHHVPLQPT